MTGVSMNIISQAAKRLEQLRSAGVDLPWRPVEQAVAAAGLPANDSPAPEDLKNLSTDRSDHAGVAAGHRAEVATREVELNLAELANAGCLVPGSANTALASEFRVIKRPLLFSGAAAGASAIARGNLILITSALPGEGKTFTAVNLALSIAAEVDKSVLLVDADVLKPSVSKRLSIEESKGLLDYLENPSLPLSSLMLRTNIQKFTVLPAGMPRPNAAELLSSAAMLSLFEELASRYSDRVIVVDGPPLLPTTEARILTSLVGQVVIVVESGRTTASLVSEAFQAVTGDPVVMSVLNKRSGPPRNHGYGYGY